MLNTPSFAVDHHQELYAALPKAVRDDVDKLLQAMSWIWRAENKKAACAALAEAHNHERGFTVGSLWGKFWRYRKGGEFPSGDWRLLVDKVRAGAAWQKEPRIKLPPAAIELFQSYCAQGQRGKVKAAHARFVAQWRRWWKGDQKAAIPGYNQCPAPEPRTGLPPGFTYSTLWRHRPTRFEAKVVHIGPKAAAAHRPKLMGTRVGLELGQYYQFDDGWNDFKVNYPGSRRAARLLSFHCIDLLSACNVCRGHKPALDDDETGVQERLREREMVFLVAHLLGTYGYRKSGTTLIVESGTATVREREEKILGQFSHGKITVDRGRTDRRSRVAGLFDGASKGNPRFKAAIESHFNLLRNRMDDALEIEGQTGSNSRLNMPEQLTGRDWHNSALVQAASVLPAEITERLVLDFLSFTEGVFAVDALIDQINRRTDHELEGWRKCGFYTHEWRPTTAVNFLPLASLMALPEAERQAMAAYVRNTADLTRERPLSPHEVWSAGRQHLVKLPPHAIGMLLDELQGTEVVVRNGTIEQVERDVDPDEPLVYEALRCDNQGTTERLRDGDKYLARINPLSPGQLWLYGSKNQFLGICPQWGRTRRDDPDALARQYGRLHKAEAELLRPARRQAARMTRLEIAKRRQNINALTAQSDRQTGHVDFLPDYDVMTQMNEEERCEVCTDPSELL